MDLSYDERLELLLDALVQERENRLIGRLIRNAEFKYPNASPESLDHDPRQIKKSTIINLAAMGFISNATNLFILGPTGAGKTYLSCALGIEACRQTYRVSVNGLVIGRDLLLYLVVRVALKEEIF